MVKTAKVFYVDFVYSVSAALSLTVIYRAIYSQDEFNEGTYARPGLSAEEIFITAWHVVFIASVH